MNRNLTSSNKVLNSWTWKRLNRSWPNSRTTLRLTRCSWEPRNYRSRSCRSSVRTKRPNARPIWIFWNWNKRTRCLLWNRESICCLMRRGVRNRNKKRPSFSSSKMWWKSWNINKNKRFWDMRKQSNWKEFKRRAR